MENVIVSVAKENLNKLLYGGLIVDNVYDSGTRIKFKICDHVEAKGGGIEYKELQRRVNNYKTVMGTFLAILELSFKEVKIEMGTIDLFVATNIIIVYCYIHISGSESDIKTIHKIFIDGVQDEKK